MNHALQAVLQQALIEAVLAYLSHCNCTQADIDRVKNIKDDEILKLVSHASFNGVAWKIVLHDAEFNPHTGLSIPLDPMQHRTFYLLILWRELEKLQNITDTGDFRKELSGAAHELQRSFQYDADFWGAYRCPIPFTVDYLETEPFVSFFVDYTRELFDLYIRELLA